MAGAFALGTVRAPAPGRMTVPQRAEADVPAGLSLSKRTK